MIGVWCYSHFLLLYEILQLSVAWNILCHSFIIYFFFFQNDVFYGINCFRFSFYNQKGNKLRTENADYIQDNLNLMYGSPTESPKNPTRGLEIAAKLMSRKPYVDMASSTQMVGNFEQMIFGIKVEICSSIFIFWTILTKQHFYWQVANSKLAAEYMNKSMGKSTNNRLV